LGGIKGGLFDEKSLVGKWPLERGEGGGIREENAPNN